MTMGGDFNSMIGRSNISGAQREQKPPIYREKPAVRALRRSLAKHNKKKPR